MNIISGSTRGPGFWGFFAMVIIIAAAAGRITAVEKPAAKGRRIAVLPLKDISRKPGTAWIGEGAAEALVTNLARIGTLTIIERSQISKIMDEQDFKISQMKDTSAILKLGKLAGADRLLIGSYSKPGWAINFNVRVVDVETGVVLSAAKFQTTPDKIPGAFSQLAEAVLRSFDKIGVIRNNIATAVPAPKSQRITLTKAQKKHLNRFGTTNSKAHKAYSLALLEKKPARKIQLYTQAIQLDKRYSWAFNNRGNVYFRQRKLKKALADYNRAIYLDQTDYLAHNNRGACLADMGQLDKGIAEMTDALALNPKYVQAYVNRGFSYMQKRKYRKAIIDFNRAADLLPKRAGTYNGRAQAYMKIGKYSNAWQDVKTCKKLGGKISKKFIADLRKVSKRNK